MNKNAVSTIEQKVVWLLIHRIHLVGNLNLKKVAIAMKHDGLLSKTTYWLDAKTGIEAAVKKARLRWYAEHNGREIRP